MKHLTLMSVIIALLLATGTPLYAQSGQFEVTLTDGSVVQLSDGDMIKLAIYAGNNSAIKHPILLGTSHSIHLDNGRFDNNGDLSYTTIDGTNQDVTMDHSEMRYNLVVSIEWDADLAYINSVKRSFRNLSNFLYDVTDGQARLDTVKIYDDQDHWLEADIRIRASNTQWPTGSINGIHLTGLGEVITFPRKWYGDGDETRNGSYTEAQPIDFSASSCYRQMAHELGHYLFGFDEEYEFSDGLGHCAAVSNYGIMDYPYSDGGEYASEMSNPALYLAVECQNTFQYQRYLQSCWEQFESDYEKRYGADSILAAIITPTERGVTPFTGPNDDLANLNYDVGALVQFPVAHSGPSSFTLDVVTHDWQLNPLPNVDVVLRHPTLGGSYYDMYQGRSCDLNLPGTPGGAIYVLGAQTGDLILASSDYTITGIARSTATSFTKQWLTAQATVGAQGDSLVLQLSPVEGDFPLLPEFMDFGDSTRLSLRYAAPFTAPPTVEGLDVIGDFFTYGFTSSGAVYQSDQNEQLANAGTFTIHAKDSADNPFFFNLDYTRALWEKSAPQELLGPHGVCAIQLDSGAFDNAQVALMLSAYPVMRDGLPATAYQVGNTCALSVSQAPFSGELALRYSASDMQIDNSHTGGEASIQLYHWGAAGWEPVGGALDTANNVVRATVSESGAYALFTSDILTDVAEDQNGESLPESYALSQNYPNPFNPSTTIEFSLPSSARVTLDVYNILGQRIRNLLDAELPAGRHMVDWDSRNAEEQPVASGVYFYRLATSEHSETRKMILMK